MIDYAKLERAAALIAEVTEDLDVRVASCDHCPSEHYEHYGNFLLNSRLKNLPHKLTSLSEQTQRGCFDSPVKQEPKTKK